METVRPTLWGISIYKEEHAIIYKCPMCECSLKLLGRIQNYCYKCGAKFDWSGLPDYLTKEQSNKFDNIIDKYSDGEIDYSEYRNQKQSLLDEICKGE